MNIYDTNTWKYINFIKVQITHVQKCMTIRKQHFDSQIFEIIFFDSIQISLTFVSMDLIDKLPFIYAVAWQ